MCKIICVTAMELCGTSFLEQLKKIALSRTDSIILREKNLSENSYRRLAKSAVDVCGEKLVLHTFYDTAIELGFKRIHLPLPVLEAMPKEKRSFFEVLGSSVHSREQALRAQALGCTYITAGHIFSTDCKRGLPPRGLDFLCDVKKSVHIPVYGIGGIGPQNIGEVVGLADGACIMSGFMKAADPIEFTERLIQNGI